MHCCMARERLINILILILILKRVVSFLRCYVITETDWIATTLSYHGNFFNHHYISTKISWVNSFWALEFPKCPIYNRRNLQRDYSRVFIGWGGGREYWMIYRDQAFLPSHDLAPPPRPPPSPSVSSIGDTQKDWGRETTCWRWRGEEPNQTTARKHGPL